MTKFKPGDIVEFIPPFDRPCYKRERLLLTTFNSKMMVLKPLKRYIQPRGRTYVIDIKSGSDSMFPTRSLQLWDGRSQR